MTALLCIGVVVLSVLATVIVRVNRIHLRLENGALLKVHLKSRATPTESPA